MSVTGPFETIPGFAAAHMYSTYGDDAATAAAVLEEYLLELPKELALMQENFSQQRYYELYRNLHRIKPGFLYVGLHDLYHKTIQLENLCAADGTNDCVRKLFPVLFQEIADSSTLIETVINSLKLHS